MHVTREGTVTIPEAIRRKLGIDETTEVEFVEEDGKVVLTVREPGEETFEEWLDRVQGITEGGLTTEEVMRVFRGEEWPDDPR